MTLMDSAVYRITKDNYAKLRRNGENRDTAVAYLVSAQVEETPDESAPEWLIFWIALAEAQCRYGELTEHIRERALLGLDKLEAHTGIHLAPGEIKKKQLRYAEKTGAEKQLVKRKKYHCVWQAGDVFSYPLAGAESAKCGLDNALGVFQKTGEFHEEDGMVCPLVTLRIWKDPSVPITADTLLCTPLLRMDALRAIPVSRERFDYQAELYITGRGMLKQIPLTSHGNFPVAPMPEDEFRWFDHYPQTKGPSFLGTDYSRYICDHYIYDQKTRAGIPTSWWDKEGQQFMAFLQSRGIPQEMAMFEGILQRYDELGRK